MTIKKFFITALVVCVLGATAVTVAGYWFLNSFAEAMQDAEQELDAQRMVDLEQAEKARCAKMPQKERLDAWWCP